jgi:hypothetical protein
MFQKSLSYLKVLGAGRVALGNFCSDDPSILEVTVKILSPRDVGSRDLCNFFENEEKLSNTLSKKITVSVSATGIEVLY